MDAGLMALMTFVGILGGGAITAFWKKKAENYATKQDVAELTTITKKIEADISSEVWDRQKQWEMKREVIFDMSRKISTAGGLAANSTTLGNDLAKTHEVDILCAYPLSSFDGEEDEHVFQSICAEHSAVYSQ